MAWPTTENYGSYCRSPKEPDMVVLQDWLERMEPLIRAETEGEIICVFGNVAGKRGEVAYAGTSAVLGIVGGEVKVYGYLGRCEKELLVVDTNQRPIGKLVRDHTGTASEAPCTLDYNGTVSTQCNTPGLEDPNHLVTPASSNRHQEFSTLRPYSPLERPKSPKLRNTSRTRPSKVQLYSSAELSDLLDTMTISQFSASNGKKRRASVSPNFLGDLNGV